jgi:hypothetical protein
MRGLMMAFALDDVSVRFDGAGVASHADRAV